MANRKLLTNNAQTVLQLLLERLNQVYSRSWNDDHLGHPDYPSFASFYYLLRKRGIESKALHVSYEELETLPSPMMVHIRENGGMFLLLEKTDENQVYVINEKKELETNPADYFKSSWDGNVMIFDSEHIQIKPENIILKIKRYFRASVKPMAIFSTLLIFIGIFIYTADTRSIYNDLYLCAYAVGLFISILFLIRQFDASNSLIDKICHTKAIKKADCSSILDTQAAYFMGLFSWSDFGFIYFVSLFLIALLFPAISIPVAIICSFLSFPYVFYSVWYQWRIAKSWCMLCLATQGVLLILFLIALFTWPVSIDTLWSVDLLYVVAIPLMVIAVYSLLKPMYNSHRRLPNLSRQYSELKHNDLFFNAVFEQQQQIDTSNLDKMTFNPEGTDCITVIFNPTCSPCMKKLPYLFSMLQDKKETRLEMIFFLNPGHTEDESYPLAKCMLSAYEESPEEFMQMMNDYATHYPGWKKQLRKEYPASPETDERMSLYLKNQNEWCLGNQIYSTPLIFFNYRKLPDIYSLYDLDYHCN